MVYIVDNDNMHTVLILYTFRHTHNGVIFQNNHTFLYFKNVWLPVCLYLKFMIKPAKFLIKLGRSHLKKPGIRIYKHTYIYQKLK